MKTVNLWTSLKDYLIHSDDLATPVLWGCFPGLEFYLPENVVVLHRTQQSRVRLGVPGPSFPFIARAPWDWGPSSRACFRTTLRVSTSSSSTSGKSIRAMQAVDTTLFQTQEPEQTSSPAPEPELEKAQATAFVKAQDVEWGHMPPTIPDPEHAQQLLAFKLKSQNKHLYYLQFQSSSRLKPLLSFKNKTEQAPTLHPA